MVLPFRTVTANSTHQRAKALPIDERRATIISAALPLLAAHGSTVTTRQIAEAAGIAEGTVFRAFADKESLIADAIAAAFDPADVVAQIAAVDPALELRERLICAVEIVAERVTRLFTLLNALGVSPAAAKSRSTHATAELAALADLIRPDAAQLRLGPDAAARIVRGLTFVGTHPLFCQDHQLDAAQIVELAFHGMSADA